MKRESRNRSSKLNIFRKGAKSVAKKTHSVAKGIGTVGSFIPVVGTVFRDPKYAYGWDRGSNETKRVLNESNALSWQNKSLKEKASHVFWDARGAIRASQTLSKMKKREKNNKKKREELAKQKKNDLERLRKKREERAKIKSWINTTTYNTGKPKTPISLNNVQQFLAPSKADLSAKKLGKQWKKKASNIGKTRKALSALKKGIENKKKFRQMSANKLTKQYLKDRKIVDNCIIHSVDIMERMPYKEAFQKFVNTDLNARHHRFKSLKDKCPKHYLQALRRRQQYLDEQSKSQKNAKNAKNKLNRDISKCVNKFIDNSGKTEPKEAIIKFIEKQDWTSEDIMKLKEICGKNFHDALQARQDYLSNRNDFMSKNSRTQRKIVYQKKMRNNLNRLKKTAASRARERRNTTGKDPRVEKYFGWNGY